MIPKRRRAPKMGLREPSVIRCPQHLQWVRGHECALEAVPLAAIKDIGAKLHAGRVEAAHVRRGGDGGTGMKPGDDRVIPLCTHHHREQHQIGESTFEARYGIKMAEIAADLWRVSPHGIRYRSTHERD